MEKEAAALSGRPGRAAGASAGRNVLLFLSVIGPGIITANVDNDAGGITTYSLAGAQYGTGLLWTLIPITIALIVVQEMSARMGAVTGKGLADLVRENFGVKLTFYFMSALLVDELRQHGVGVRRRRREPGALRRLEVDLGPVAALAIWVLVVRGTYRLVERIFLVACVFYFVYPISAFLAKPDWREVLRDTVDPVARLRSTRATSGCSSASSARRSRRGCSSICSRAWSRRGSARTATGSRAGTSSWAAS